MHYNFVVRGPDPDGAHAMLFAEVDPERAGEEDVHLCTPLQDTNNKGPCFSCKHRARGLMHPAGAGYLGGHMETNFLDFELPDSSDDEYI